MEGKIETTTTADDVRQEIERIEEELFNENNQHLYWQSSLNEDRHSVLELNKYGEMRAARLDELADQLDRLEAVPA